MHFRRILGAALACVALNAFAQDQTAPTTETNSTPPELKDDHKVRMLTMDEAIALALDHNLDLQISRLTPLEDLYGVYGAYGAYEPDFKFNARHSFNSTPGKFNQTADSLNPPTDLNVDFYQPEIAGSLPTGLTYDFTGPLNVQNGNTVPLSSKYNSSPGVTLSQPILKNFWIDQNRLTIRLDKNLLQTDQEGLRLKIMTVVTSVKTAYFNLIAARENVKVNVKALELADQLVAENRKRVQVGALAPLDEKQSESQAATSRANVLASEQSLNTAENTLKNLLTDNFSEWADLTPLPAESLVVVPETVNLQESWRRGVTQRPEMAQAKLAVEKQNLNIKYYQNQFFPEVDINGSYGRNATDPTFYDNLGDIRAGNTFFYSYGVTVTIPLGGNVASRNAYQSAKLSKKQALLQLKQQEQTIVVAIDNDVKVIRTDLQQVDATREARIYAEAALDAEQKKLENGKSTSFVVLQLQSNLTSARSAEIAAQASYNIALEQLALDEGATLERNHIDLKKK